MIEHVLTEIRNTQNNVDELLDLIHMLTQSMLIQEKRIRELEIGVKYQ